MSMHDQGAALIMSAAEPTIRLVRDIDADQLGAPTPCTDYNVRGLINHLLFWAPTLLGAGRKELVPPPADNDRDMDLTGGDWAAKLVASIKDLATTWGTPEAWDGVTRMGGPTEMPAAMVGGMVLGELVVHGWDLAASTGQRAVWPDDVIDFVHRGIADTAQIGRQHGVFGPVIPVPSTASTMDKLLGLSGRDPRWVAR